ncbi:MAG TPA: NAD(P)-dependent oxidoreductase, partial [Rhodoglobus sp.]|nr:NAD(P)-dependent oxidoreductase [Rhodoglobus sp.]
RRQRARRPLVVTERTVLVTGAAGALGSVLVRELPCAGWTVRPLVRTPDAALPDAVVGSVDDLEVMMAATEGVDAVVHLGGLSLPGREWQEYLHVNIDGTRTTLEAARRTGVRRVALASSNHAVGYLHRGDADLPTDVAARPDSFYGVSKAAVEALGTFYADEYGMHVVNQRIGSGAERPRTPRMLATWLSMPDFVRLTLASIDGDWTGAHTVWGISRNTRRWWSLAEGYAIGYEPQDDAEAYAHEVDGADSDYVGGDTPPTVSSSSPS